MLTPIHVKNSRQLLGINKPISIHFTTKNCSLPLFCNWSLIQEAIPGAYFWSGLLVMSKNELTTTHRPSLGRKLPHYKSIFKQVWQFHHRFFTFGIGRFIFYEVNILEDKNLKMARKWTHKARKIANWIATNERSLPAYGKLSKSRRATLSHFYAKGSDSNHGFRPLSQILAICRVGLNWKT